MKNKKIKKMKTTRLQKEIEVKDLIIKQLLFAVTENKIKIPEKLLKNINFLYAGNSTKI